MGLNSGLSFEHMYSMMEPYVEHLEYRTIARQRYTDDGTDEFAKLLLILDSHRAIEAGEILTCTVWPQHLRMTNGEQPYPYPYSIPHLVLLVGVRKGPDGSWVFVVNDPLMHSGPTEFTADSWYEAFRQAKALTIR